MGAEFGCQTFMNPDGFILKLVERRSRSIYSPFRTGHTPKDMGELLADADLALSLKFTAVLAAYAHLPLRLPPPLRLRDFRALIPDDFWAEHFSFHYTKYLGGFVATECGDGETWYSLRVGPNSSPYGTHGVTLVSLTEELCLPDDSWGTFHPSLEATVTRFTLSQPFMQWELHEGTDIYISTRG